MFTKAIEWGLAIENPVRHFRTLHVEDGRCRCLNDGESERLLKAVKGTLRSLTQVALNTGMRRGELFHLKWKEVDFRNEIVRVVDSKNGESRELPMNETLRTTLKGIPRRLGSVYVFPGRTGEHLKDVSKGFKKALKAAQIEDFRFHDLRHTFASRLIMAGADLATVRELLGHKNIKMTLRYAHLAPHHKRAAIQLLDTYMDTKSKEAIS
jgi:integrase